MQTQQNGNTFNKIQPGDNLKTKSWVNEEKQRQFLISKFRTVGGNDKTLPELLLLTTCTALIEECLYMYVGRQYHNTSLLYQVKAAFLFKSDLIKTGFHCCNKVSNLQSE